MADEHQHQPYVQPGVILVAPGHSYRVDCLLGEGGMARAYGCFERDTHIEVAVKVLNEKYARERGDIYERFCRESRIPGLIANLIKKCKTRGATKSLLKVIAIGELTDGSPYYAMTRLSGCTLHAQIQRTSLLARKLALKTGMPVARSMPLATALNIITELLVTLEALHQCGVVHRDVKPANIFLHKAPGEPAAVVLLDYGIAHLMDEGPRTGVAGSPGYIAPEHFTGEIGPPADIFAVGVLLFSMIAGEKPADGFGSAWPVGGETRKAPSLAPFGVVPALVALVARCLALDPRDRPTAADLYEQLLEISLALPAVDVGTAVTEDDPVDRTAAGESTAGISIVDASPATSPDVEVTARMNALRVLNERRAALGLPPLTHIPNHDTTPMQGRPLPPVPGGPVIPMAGRRQQTVPMGPAHIAPVLRPPMPAVDLVTMPPASSSPSPLGPISRPEYAPESMPMTGPDPIVARLPDRRLLAEALQRAAQTGHANGSASPAPPPASARTVDGPIGPASRGSSSSGSSTMTALARTPRAEPRRLERLFAALRERPRALRCAIAAGLATRRERSAIRARAKSAAATRERAEKAAARAARLEGQRLAAGLAAHERSELELADKQRQVEKNRQRRREAEARGEEWKGEPADRPFSSRLTIAIWALALCLGLGVLGAFVVRRNAIRVEPAAPVASTIVVASAPASAASEVAASEVAASEVAASEVAAAEIAPPATISTVVLAPPAPVHSVRAAAPRPRVPSSPPHAPAAPTAPTASATAVKAAPPTSSPIPNRTLQTVFE